MSERTRDFLKPEFRDGERPSGADFADLIDSFVNKQTDGVSFDSDGNLVLVRGVRLGNSAGTVAGGLRFNNNQLQVFTGGAWVNVSGRRRWSVPAGRWQCDRGRPTTETSASARSPRLRRSDSRCLWEPAAAPPTRCDSAMPCAATAAAPLLDSPCSPISSGRRTMTSRCGNRPTVPCISTHRRGRSSAFVQGGTQIRIGDFNATAMWSSALKATSQVPGRRFFRSREVPSRPTAPLTWTTTSDARIKEDVRDLERGLSELRQVRPVRFRYNGRAGTLAGQAAVGVLGQEIETVLPETIQRASVADDPGLNDMRVFDPSALTYVLINAVKELAARVEHLEQALAAATAATSSGPVVT